MNAFTGPGAGPEALDQSDARAAEATGATGTSGATAATAAFAPARHAAACGPLEACAERLRQAAHLSPGARTAALALLNLLADRGRVRVDDTLQGRNEAVAGIQWAMEQVLQGPEVIMTPERTTPFRCVGDPDRPRAQQVRDQGLRERFQRGDPLHLVFCHDGTGTPAQDHAYRREILDPAREAGEPLFEHVLPWRKAEFPAGLSGAFVLSRDQGRPVAFAIRAAQVDQRGTLPCLTLWWGDCNPSPRGPAAAASAHAQPRGMKAEAASRDEATFGDEASLDDVLREWSQYLQQHIGRDLGSLWSAEMKPPSRR